MITYQSQTPSFIKYSYQPTHAQSIQFETENSNMAEVSDEPCVSKEAFYKHLDTLKSKQLRKESQVTLFIEDAIFDKAKAYLKYEAEKQLGFQSEEVKLSKWETSTITRKKWAYLDDSIITPNKRKVVPKRQLYEVLSLAHTRTAHRGRQITSKWINDNYSELNVKVIAIFVALCPIHAEQQSVTSRIKLVNKPIQSPTFLSLVEQCGRTPVLEEARTMDYVTNKT